MKKNANYVIFPVKWGYFGIAGREKCLLRTCLPGPRYQEIKACLLKNMPLAQFNRFYVEQLQEQIVAYFDGAAVDFTPDIPVDLSELRHFQTAVLTACRQIKLGRTITYAQLAKEVGKPNAARA
ncbi:MAG: methylated-DNA--[protein]-cysteine S-methyltransferase, partial [Sedimentisphaerales bacterium]|nr:methylated-DNA--[protein]-cysteine S-methyltransferase [Sedimentisphaerales bacterium]